MIRDVNVPEYEIILKSGDIENLTMEAWWKKVL